MNPLYLGPGPFESNKMLLSKGLGITMENMMSAKKEMIEEPSESQEDKKPGLMRETNEDLIFKVLSGVKKNKDRVIAWKILPKGKITCDVELGHVHHFKNEIKIIPLEGNNEKLKQILSSRDDVNIFLPSEGVLFQSKISHYSTLNELTIEFPKFLARFERRKSVRLKLSSEDYFEIEFSKKETKGKNIVQFKKNCFDISRSGVSFMVTRAELKFFEVHDTLYSAILDINEGPQIVFNGEIVNIIEIDPSHKNNLAYKGFKVCLKFDSISREDQQTLDNYIFERIEIDASLLG